MFGKKRGVPTVIGEGASFEGTLRLRGALHVDGVVDGNVVIDGSLSVGPQGVVRGDVTADGVSIAGRVEARVAARGHLHMLPGGVLRGDATYQTLQVDSGGVIEGHTLREDVEPARAPAMV